MATYEEIYGKRVKDFDSDPTLESSYEGQVWYDKSTGVLKSVVALEAFSSSAPLLTARNNTSGAGTQTAALAVGGNFPSNMRLTEEYNGVGWSTQTNAPYDAQLAASIGTQTAAATFGGISPPGKHATTVEYDGSSWTSGGDLNTARSGLTGCGTQTAGLATRGDAPNPSPPPDSTGGQYTEEYNGTSWTNGNNTNDARRNSPASFGTQTAAVACGGGQPNESPSNTTEEYDGTNWTSVNNMNTARLNLGGAGVLTSGIIFGGQTGPGGGALTGATETYDGTNWTTSPATMGSPRAQRGTRAGSSSSSALAFAGYDTTQSAATEEFNSSINVITAAAWASGDNLNTARGSAGGAGSTQNASLMYGGGGSGGAGNNETEEYNGSTWSEQNNLSTGRGEIAGFGTQTAAVAFGGEATPGFNQTNAVEEYDGSSWTSGNNFPTGNLKDGQGTGILTAGLAWSGNGSVSPMYTLTSEYDGTNWTSGGAYPEAVISAGGSGTQTAGLGMGGYTTERSSDSKEYNGSSWTAGGSLNTSRQNCTGASSQALQTAAFIAGGDAPPPGAITTTETYDGTSFATSQNISTARFSNSASSTQTSALVFGGRTPSNSNATEEFTAETETVTASTLTSS